MTRERGLTLVELLFTLAILAIVLSVAAPSLSELLRDQRASVATQELRNTLDFARESAVHSGQSISIAATRADWAAGWEAFVDPGNRGSRDPQQPPLAAHDALSGISIRTDSTSRRYIHFTPRGNAIQPNGAFHSGTLTLCGEGRTSYRIVFNKAGRIRTEPGITEDLCPH
ncbi:GspH/FimT family pseudopilin [Pseudomonas nitroreducens]|uniref:GspH/FimT family pseudopilin n=1 Tax=Pseudomonas nitroreducens TaxID=46680 RepID=UPI000A07798D|nr:GspH/FimT family pseudopilin [Pseudomonas nitroreducens]NMZ61939.1 prepilin-type N-terminal cleavage/methylation domain-containing protein [Pseudomonas nitroreducens]SNT20979.1 type IV fimbrial biogenesis protein FimT [Pseudomonas nitroreducens]